MSTETHNYITQSEQEARHSALTEFSRDERRPAVMLLCGLIIAAIFFGLGLVFGRWTAEPKPGVSVSSPAAPAQASTKIQNSTPQTATPARNEAAATSPDNVRRFTLFVASFDSPVKAQPLVRALQNTGYTDVRVSTPSTGEAHSAYAVLVGHFTEEEAHTTAQRMQAVNDPRLKNVKIVSSEQ